MIIPIGDIQKPEKIPYVNYALLGINILVYLFVQPNELTADADAIHEFFLKYAFVPAEISLQGILFSMFMHAGIFHLAGNMLFLWIAGDNVEDRLGKIGYFFFYIACGFAASMAHFLFNMESLVPCIGASGAIAGVMGAYFLLCPRNQVRFFYWMFFFIGTFYVSARVAVGFWFVEQLIMFLVYHAGGGVAFDAHLGGIVFGFLVVLALIKLGIASPYLAAEHYRASARRVSSFAHDHRGRPFIQYPGPNPYSRYSRRRSIFSDRPPPQNADWLHNAYASPTYTPPWQQATTAPGLFTIVARKPILNRIADIAPVVASLTGATPDVASHALRTNYGVIARDVSGELAASLEASLAQIDVAVFVMKNEDLIDIPPVRELTNLTASDPGMTLYFDGSSLSKRRDEIFLVVCGVVAGAPTLDIYTYEPWARFRASEGSHVFERPTLSNIRSIMARILHGHNMAVNRGVKVLVDGGDWGDVAFSSHEDFDRYCYWLIQVVNARNRGMT